jgi:hypothetical protein
VAPAGQGSSCRPAQWQGRAWLLGCGRAGAVSWQAPSCYMMIHHSGMPKHLRYCTPQDRHNGPPYTGCHKSKETIVLLVANQPAFQHLAETMDPDAYAADMYQAVRCTTEPPAGPTQGRSAAVGTIRTVQSHIDMEGRHLPNNQSQQLCQVKLQTGSCDYQRTPRRWKYVAGPLPTPAPDAAVQAHLLFPGDRSISAESLRASCTAV